jgi:hypothetical protein
MAPNQKVAEIVEAEKTLPVPFEASFFLFGPLRFCLQCFNAVAHRIASSF